MIPLMAAQSRQARPGPLWGLGSLSNPGVKAWSQASDRACDEHECGAVPGFRSGFGRVTSKLLPGEARGETLRRFEQTAHRAVDGLVWSSIDRGARVLVTGGTGCIGDAVVRLLQQEDLESITSVSRRLPGTRAVPGVHYRACDIRDLVALYNVFSAVRPDVVVHLAAQRDPARAEVDVLETISTNVIGTRNVLEIAGRVGASSVAVASTGKALRYYTSNVYASTKKVVEHLTESARLRWNYSANCARFTHVVNNSLVFDKFLQATRFGAPIPLHAANVWFYVQSALESAQLVLASAGSGGGGTFALRDLGEPIELVELARDLAARVGVEPVFEIIGFEQGYEASAHPATYDAGSVDRSLLVNAIEARRTILFAAAPGSVDVVPTSGHVAVDFEERLANLIALVRLGADPVSLRVALSAATVSILRGCLVDVDERQLTMMLRSSSLSAEPRSPDHALVDAELAMAFSNRAASRGVRQTIDSRT
jgi:nucleoside-diphosphate-sugar epimerase